MQNHHTSAKLIAASLVAMTMVMVVAPSSVLYAQAPPAATNEPAKKPGADAVIHETASMPDEAEPQPATVPPAAEEHKKQVVTVGMLVLVFVCMLGLMLIGITIAWGNRVRKVARRPLPQQSKIDELWYLKASRKASAEATGEKPSADGTNAPESDRPESS